MQNTIKDLSESIAMRDEVLDEKDAQIKAQGENESNHYTNQSTKDHGLSGHGHAEVRTEEDRRSEGYREIDNHKCDISRLQFELSEKKEQAEMAFVEKRLWTGREMSLENAIGELKDEG